MQPVLNVLSQEARSHIAKDCRTDLPSLFALLRARGERIASYGHSAPWIDVNDAASLDKAESLIEQHSSELGAYYQMPQQRERIACSATEHRLEEPHQVIPQHGCILAVSASVSHQKQAPSAAVIPANPFAMQGSAM
jgi:NDP-sugar pyrophosphorylase family protein